MVAKIFELKGPEAKASPPTNQSLAHGQTGTTTPAQAKLKAFLPEIAPLAERQQLTIEIETVDEGLHLLARESKERGTDLNLHILQANRPVLQAVFDQLKTEGETDALLFLRRIQKGLSPLLAPGKHLPESLVLRFSAEEITLFYRAGKPSTPAKNSDYLLSTINKIMVKCLVLLERLARAERKNERATADKERIIVARIKALLMTAIELKLGQATALAA
ncbi:MAG: hypothetical protein PHH14_04420 [Candidatus Margulisbacteria bacterium]|nr:hypothetical protein [Candidatus Margulisiibacteriota bacterium]